MPRGGARCRGTGRVAAGRGALPRDGALPRVAAGRRQAGGSPAQRKKVKESRRQHSIFEFVFNKLRFIKR